MYKAQQYRSIIDNLFDLEAIQYRNPWESTNAIVDIASFVLQMDTDRSVSIANESTLDVVSPVMSGWDAERGLAPIMVVDPDPFSSTPLLSVKVGDWVCRHLLPGTNALVVIGPDEFKRTYVEIVEESPRSELEILRSTISKNLPGEGEFYEDVALKVAISLISEGWSRKE